MTKVHRINCINCPNLCKKFDKKQFQKFLEDLHETGCTEILFTCEIKEEVKKELSKFDPKVLIGQKQKNSQIKYFNK